TSGTAWSMTCRPSEPMTACLPTSVRTQSSPERSTNFSTEVPGTVVSTTVVGVSGVVDGTDADVGGVVGGAVDGVFTVPAEVGGADAGVDGVVVTDPSFRVNSAGTPIATRTATAATAAQMAAGRR